MDQTGKIVEIKPKGQFLSPTELIAQRHLEVEPVRVGLKRTYIENAEDHEKELRISYAKLRAQMSMPRIERLGGRSSAVWDDQQQAVQVLRKDGKFENFGHTKNGKDYLEYYEALFLLELGRLQLEYFGINVSVEQAYILLLGEVSSKKHDEYLVYSNFSRVGYIVTKHRNAATIADNSQTYADCIWALVRHNLGQQQLPEHVQALPMHVQAKANMESIKQRILQPSQETLKAIDEPSHFKYVLKKRKATPATAGVSKKPRATVSNVDASASGSLLDILKSEHEFEKFKEIFNSLDVVQLQSNENLAASPSCRDLDISFDLHLHNEGYSKRRTDKLPTFHIIILSRGAKFPTHDEIALCQRHQTHATPLLVVTVSESKQIQAFIYHCS